MNIYAESSAVLAWLLAEPAGERVQPHLRDAETIVSSELTLVETARALRRAVVLSDVLEADAAELHGLLAAAAREWHVIRLDTSVLDRAGQAFPAEPVRTLDALHLASALLAATALPDLAVLSLDVRVRRNATAMGLGVLPPGQP